MPMFYMAIIEFKTSPFEKVLFNTIENFDEKIVFYENGVLKHLKVFTPIWKIYAEVDGNLLEIKDYYIALPIIASVRYYASPNFVF